MNLDCTKCGQGYVVHVRSCVHCGERLRVAEEGAFLADQKIASYKAGYGDGYADGYAKATQQAQDPMAKQLLVKAAALCAESDDARDAVLELLRLCGEISNPLFMPPLHAAAERVRSCFDMHPCAVRCDCIHDEVL